MASFGVECREIWAGADDVICFPVSADPEQVGLRSRSPSGGHRFVAVGRT